MLVVITFLNQKPKSHGRLHKIFSSFWGEIYTVIFDIGSLQTHNQALFSAFYSLYTKIYQKYCTLTPIQTLIFQAFPYDFGLN